MTIEADQRPCKWFDPHKGLIELPIVWGTVVFVLPVAFSLTVMIFANESLSFKPTSDGLNEAVRIFQVPLGLVAFLIPLLAFYAANHRSEQTKEQLAITRSQSSFTNYYQHRQDFEEEILKRIHPLKYVRIENPPRRFYQAIFPRGRSGDFRVDVTGVIELETVINRLNDALPIQEANSIFQEAESGWYIIESWFGITRPGLPYEFEYTDHDGDTKVVTFNEQPPGGYVQYFQDLRDAHRVVNDVLESIEEWAPEARVELHVSGPGQSIPRLRERQRS